MSHLVSSRLFLSCLASFLLEEELALISLVGQWTGRTIVVNVLLP